MTENFRYNFKFQDLGINVSQIGKLLDYEKGSNKDMISCMIMETLDEAEDLCDIRAEIAIWEGVTFIQKQASMQIGGVNFDLGKIISAQVRKSESVAVFACTAGERIGNRAREWIHEKDFLKGYILDLIGSRAADGSADLMQENLKIMIAERGMKITNRYSPGYCGWNVAEQHKLFSLLPENYCGIQLNDSALMQPIKSVSGIIGIGSGVRFNKYSCNLCDQQNCIYRNYKNDPER
jgi:Vitamin B12 dependent methionine synthase, activation domain